MHHSSWKYARMSTDSTLSKLKKKIQKTSLYKLSKNVKIVQKCQNYKKFSGHVSLSLRRVPEVALPARVFYERKAPQSTLLCRETKYCRNLRAFWKAFLELSTKFILLSEIFQQKSFREPAFRELSESMLLESFQRVVCGENAFVTKVLCLPCIYLYLICFTCSPSFQYNGPILI